jgi:hypothetical protein
MTDPASRSCIVCKRTFSPETVEVAVGQETVARELADRCVTCEADYIESTLPGAFTATKVIPPYSQVGVIPRGAVESPLVCHTTFECSPPGNTFYGYWGEGKVVSSHDKVEQC